MTAIAPERAVRAVEAEFHRINREHVPGFTEPMNITEAAERVVAAVMGAVQDNGVTRIAAERARQIVEKGTTIEHDTAIYGAGALEAGNVSDLAFAAAAYAIAEPTDTIHTNGIRSLWPWTAEDWKPTTRVRALEKAGALIAAEIDRILAKEGTR